MPNHFLLHLLALAFLVFGCLADNRSWAAVAGLGIAAGLNYALYRLDGFRWYLWFAGSLLVGALASVPGLHNRAYVPLMVLQLTLLMVSVWQIFAFERTRRQQDV